MQWKHFAVAACIAFVPLSASAAPAAGERLFTLSGSGSSDKELDNNSVNLSFDLGQFMTEQTLVGLRQSVGVSDFEGGSSWNGATRVFADYHFDMDAWQPFVGANFGGTYGDDTAETFFAGPEAGVKYFVKSKTFVTVQAEYQFFFDSADEAEANFDDGAFVYSAGIGFLF